MDHLQDLLQAVRGEAEGIAVSQKYLSWISACRLHPFQFFFDLLKGKLPVCQMFKQITEFTPVVGASHHHRQHK